MLTDTELVETFIEDSLRGQETLLANPLLKAEHFCGTNQLISRRDGILMKVDLNVQPIQFWVRNQSSYGSWLHDLLQKHRFITTDSFSEDRLYCYRRFHVLPGYEVNCEAARTLWKNWRTISRMQRHVEKAKALLIHGQHSWAEIQSMTISNELLFIKTPDGEIVTHMNDSVFWLSKAERVSEPTQPQSYWARQYGGVVHS